MTTLAHTRSGTDHRALLQVATQAEPRLARAVTASVQRVRAAVSLDDVRRAVVTGNPASIQQAIHWDDKLAPSLPNVYVPHVRKAAVEPLIDDISSVMLNVMQDAGKVVLGFDVKSPTAIDRAYLQSAQLVSGITRTTQAGIQQAVGHAVSVGETPATIAANIRDSIGLTPQQATAVANYRMGLNGVALGDTSPEALLARFTLSGPIGLQGLSSARIDKMVQQYADRQLTLRANTIARTETLRAANDGARDAWQAGVADGLLNPDAQMVWIVTEDDDLCDDCVEMDGQVMDVTEDGPPLHPNCRCTVGIAAEQGAPMELRTPESIDEGNLLRSLREEEGLNRPGLADQLDNISADRLSRIETGASMTDDERAVFQARYGERFTASTDIALPPPSLPAEPLPPLVPPEISAADAFAQDIGDLETGRNAIEAELRLYPHVMPIDEVFPYADAADGERAWQLLQDPAPGEGMHTVSESIESVRFDELGSFQGEVDTQRVADILARGLDPNAVDAGDLSLPEVYRFPDGQLFLDEGHHRAAAIALTGQDSMTARVFTLAMDDAATSEVMIEDVVRWDSMTVDELRAALNDRVGIDISFFGYNEDVARDVARTLDDLAQQYPQGLSSLHDGVLRGGRQFAASIDSQNVIASVDNGGIMFGRGSVLSVNRNIVSLNPEQIVNFLRANTDAGFTVIPRDIAGAITHEYGHVLENALDQPVTLAGRIFDGLRAADLLPADVSNIFDVVDILGPRISAYAATNVDEFVAESFADVVLNGSLAHPESQVVYNALIGLLEEG